MVHILSEHSSVYFCLKRYSLDNTLNELFIQDPNILLYILELGEEMKRSAASISEKKICGVSSVGP